MSKIGNALAAHGVSVTASFAPPQHATQWRYDAVNDGFIAEHVPLRPAQRARVQQQAQQDESTLFLRFCSWFGSLFDK